jgi:ABC-type nitrate/sulfonate/bicarbonate transport system ATPase subunit
VSAAERGMVFQEPRLSPWLTVWKNVGLGLELRRLLRSALDRTVSELLDLVGLAEFATAPQSIVWGYDATGRYRPGIASDRYARGYGRD